MEDIASEYEISVSTTDDIIRLVEKTLNSCKQSSSDKTRSKQPLTDTQRLYNLLIAQCKGERLSSQSFEERYIF